MCTQSNPPPPLLFLVLLNFHFFHQQNTEAEHAATPHVSIQSIVEKYVPSTEDERFDATPSVSPVEDISHDLDRFLEQYSRDLGQAGNTRRKRGREKRAAKRNEMRPTERPTVGIVPFPEEMIPAELAFFGIGLSVPPVFNLCLESVIDGGNPILPSQSNPPRRKRKSPGQKKKKRNRQRSLVQGETFSSSFDSVDVDDNYDDDDDYYDEDDSGSLDSISQDEDDDYDYDYGFESGSVLDSYGYKEGTQTMDGRLLQDRPDDETNFPTPVPWDGTFPDLSQATDLSQFEDLEPFRRYGWDVAKVRSHVSNRIRLFRYG